MYILLLLFFVFSLHGSSKSSTVPSHTICAQSPNLESQTSLSLEQQRHNAICIKNLPLRSSGKLTIDY